MANDFERLTRTVPCPRCAAPAGTRCTSNTGLHLRESHRARYDDARTADPHHLDIHTAGIVL